MSNLWASDDPRDWQAVLDTYWESIEKLEKHKLLELDRWFFNELCENINSKGFSKADLVKLVDWKLTRGKWRPRLLDFAKQAPEGQLKDAWIITAAALKHSGKGDCPPEKIKQALAAMTKIKGVGPATATAVLTATDPSVPFNSDEALMAACGSRDYTVKQALELTEALRKKAAALNEAAGGRVWTVREVERCLYAEQAAAKAGGKGGKSMSKGGKGGDPSAAGKRKRG